MRSVAAAKSPPLDGSSLRPDPPRLRERREKEKAGEETESTGVTTIAKTGATAGMTTETTISLAPF